MTVLDTFYILFKSNADDVKKGLKDVKKDTDEAEKTFKNLTEQTDTLGKSFLKMIEVGAGLAAGVFGLDALKNGIIDVAKFNSNLGYTANLSGQVAQNLKQMGQASAQQGGTMEGAIGNIQAVQANFAAAGLPIPSPEELMEGWRKALAGKDANTQMAMFQKLNIQDVGLRTQAVMKPSEFQQNWLQAGINTTTTDADIKAAQDFLRSESELSSAFDKLEQSIGTPLLTSIANFIKGINSFISIINTEKGIQSAKHGAGIITSDLVENTRNVLRKGINATTEDMIGKKFLKINEPEELSNADEVALEKYRIKPTAAPSILGSTPSTLPPSLTNSVTKAPPAAIPPAATVESTAVSTPNPVDEWKNAVTDPAYIKKIQATGQVDPYATEATKAFAQTTNHINNNNNVSVGNVTINTQATDGPGTADAFHSMLSNLAANASDGVSR